MPGSSRALQLAVAQQQSATTEVARRFADKSNLRSAQAVGAEGPGFEINALNPAIDPARVSRARAL